MDQSVSLCPVAVVRGSRSEILDDYWGNIISIIEFDAEQFGPDSLLGIETFSHLEVIFFLHKISLDSIVIGSRHPRGEEDFPRVGIFAQRTKNRPNRLGLSRCKLLKVDGLNLTVQGLDAIDGTPIMDIKPYLSEFSPQGETFQPYWSEEVMRNYYACK